jgi:hypothetical protein
MRKLNDLKSLIATTYDLPTRPQWTRLAISSLRLQGRHDLRKTAEKQKARRLLPINGLQACLEEREAAKLQNQRRPIATSKVKKSFGCKHLQKRQHPIKPNRGFCRPAQIMGKSIGMFLGSQLIKLIYQIAP